MSGSVEQAEAWLKKHWKGEGEEGQVQDAMNKFPLGGYGCEDHRPNTGTRETEKGNKQAERNISHLLLASGPARGKSENERSRGSPFVWAGKSPAQPFMLSCYAFRYPFLLHIVATLSLHNVQQHHSTIQPPTATRGSSVEGLH